MVGRVLSKTAIYVLLLIGTAGFILPMVWMVATSLKPIEQTMSMPPSFVPYRYGVDTGTQAEVKRGEVIEVPSLIIRDPETGRERLVAAAQVVNGRLVQRDTAGLESAVPVEVLRDVPASPDNPWVRVLPVSSEARDKLGDWLVVPASDVTAKVAPRWSNYPKALAAMKEFPAYLKNTLFLCLMTVLGTVFSSSMAAYGFSRIPWKGRNKMFLLCMATMMIPFPILLVPMYVLFKTIGWVGTLKPLWVPAFFAFAFNVFLLRQFFMGIPKDLSDAARIDGCSEWRIFWQIILPLCKPALMVVGLFQFMGTWNDFLGPLIYLTDQKQFTLALGLYAFQSQHGGTEWHYLMAGSVVVVLPVIVLFFFTQRAFIEGISMTGIKG